MEHKSVGTWLIMIPGFTIQSLERALLTLLQCILRRHNVPLVGFVTGIYIRQSTGNAFSWIGLL